MQALTMSHISTTVTLTQLTVFSFLDCGNSFLNGFLASSHPPIPKSILSVATRGDLLKHQWVCVTPVLKIFRWFPFSLRVKSTVLTVVLEVLHQLASCSLSTLTPLLSSLQTRLASWLFLQHAPKTPATESLHLQFLPPGIPFSHVSI